MEFDPLLVSLPAIVALTIKLLIILYARASDSHNRETQLFLLFLFAVAIVDIAEIAHFYGLANGRLPIVEFTLFYVAGLTALALLLHLAASLALEPHQPRSGRALALSGYTYGGALILLLLGTPLIVTGFERVGFTLTRVPGPLYVLLEIYTIGVCLAVLALFAYGALYQATARNRARCALLLAGLVPGATVLMAILVLLRFEITWLNSRAILPFAVSVFLLTSAYAIYQHRIFDIQFFIPWSRARRRKSAFHDGIRRLIAEIADLPSASQIVQRLSDTLRCPVALLGPSKPVFAGEAAAEMARLSGERLANIDQIVVAHEIADSRPQVYQDMKSNRIAAIVPFHPHSEGASGWLLLGDGFSDHVHSPLDFQLVEELFGKMSDLFLDRFVTLRSQLRYANRQIRTLTLQNEALQERLRETERENQALLNVRQRHMASISDQGLEHAVQAADSILPLPMVFLGRDRDMIKALRAEFREVKAFVSIASAAFRRSDTPDVLVCRIDGDNPELAAYLAAGGSALASMLYGPGAEAFGSRHRTELRHALVDLLPMEVSAELLCTRTRSLNYLHRNTFSLRDPEHPLIGVSAVFTSFLQQLQILAGFDDPVLILYDDRGLAEAAVTYLHEYGKRPGDVRYADIDDVADLIGEPGTVAVLDLADTSWDEQEDLASLLQQERAESARLVLGCRYDQLDALQEDLEELTRGFTIQVPRLHERRDDIPLLVHYYTLQFNLNSGVFSSLTQAEVRSLKLHEPGWTLQGLRRATIEFLSSKIHTPPIEQIDFSMVDSIESANQERSLEELVAEFESRIIKQALERCDGNKSQAARLLGLRPNTLHYKLERYGLNGQKRARRRSA